MTTMVTPATVAAADVVGKASLVSGSVKVGSEVSDVRLWILGIRLGRLWF